MAHALASTQSIILGKAALSTFNQGRRVSKKRAHNHLSGMRQQMHANGENWRSLDDDETIRNYVCSRNDAEDLIGDGICAIWGVFLFSPDPNTRLPHVPGRRFDWVLDSASRFDWVLEREDGSAVRIHPGSNSHGVPAYGSLQQWAPPQDGYSAPAATRGEAVKGSGKGGFQGIHQVDVLGRMDAKKFLMALRSTQWPLLPRRAPTCTRATPRDCHAIGMLLPCYCHATAMLVPGWNTRSMRFREAEGPTWLNTID